MQGAPDGLQLADEVKALQMQSVAQAKRRLDAGDGKRLSLHGGRGRRLLVLSALAALGRLLRPVHHAAHRVHDRLDERRRLVPVLEGPDPRDGHRHAGGQARYLTGPLALLLATLTLRLGAGLADVEFFLRLPLAAEKDRLGVSLMANLAFHVTAYYTIRRPNTPNRLRGD